MGLHRGARTNCPTTSVDSEFRGLFPAISGIPASRVAPSQHCPVCDIRRRDRNAPVPPVNCLFRSRATESMTSRLKTSPQRAKRLCPRNIASPACPAVARRNVPILHVPRCLFLAATTRLQDGKLPRRYRAAVWPQNERPLPLCSTVQRLHIPSRVPGVAPVYLDVVATLLHILFRLGASDGAQNSFLPLLGVPGVNRDMRQGVYQSFVSKADRWLGQGSRANQDRQDG